MITELKKKLIALGINENKFSILNGEIPDGYNITETSSDDYVAFYLDERGYRRMEMRFYNLDDAGEYLLSLIKESKAAEEIGLQKKSSIEKDFLRDKKDILNLINETNLDLYEESKNYKVKELLSQLKRLISKLDIGENFKFHKKDLDTLISNNYRELDKNVRDKILQFLNSY